MYSKRMIAAIAATLFASANAHFFISSPSPIPGSAPKDPLDASGANFPCHGADLSGGSVTQLAVGADTPLEFDLGSGANTAVHGGGSCQLSLTYETDATKLKDPASWKVIQSYVGGCPTNAMGNLPTAVMCPQSAPNCVNSFSFKIPSEAQNGNAILAWTWFNNVGNREMYMNCAKVSISGGQNQMSSLPSMMVANLASVNQCKTTENFNTDFPNPGKYVTKASTLNYPLKAPQGDCGSGSGSASVPSTGGTGSTGSGSSSAAGPVASPAAGSGSSAAAGTGSSATSSANNGQYTGVGAGSGAGSGAPKSAPAAKASSAAGNPGGVFAPGASAAAGAGTNAPAAAVPSATQIATTFVTSAAPAANTGAASPAAAAPSGGSGTCGAGQVACTASGFYCISQTTFGMCSFGCATPMQMAGGTACNNGAVMHAVDHPKRRRSIRHFHKRHVAGSF